MQTKRAREMLSNALIYSFESGCATAVGEGVPVKFAGDDDTMALAGANDPLAIGLCRKAYTAAMSTAGKPIEVILNGLVIKKVKVGTGGATRGTDAITVADGFTDAAANGGGTTSQIILGKFVQTGVAGDEVGLMMGYGRSVTA